MTHQEPAPDDRSRSACPVLTKSAQQAERRASSDSPKRKGVPKVDTTEEATLYTRPLASVPSAASIC